MNLFKKLFFVMLVVSVFSSAGIAREEKEEGSRESGRVMNNLYAKECGACHLAYQPQLLPKRSWEKIMNTLDNHFGDNASLDKAAHTEILDYVIGNSAETGGSKLGRKILASLNDAETPLRISDTPYFKKKHRKIQSDVFKRKSIVSPSNCAGCHPAAEKGDFDDDSVKIPKN